MLAISKRVMSRTVDDEEVLLDLERQAYFGLNRTGSFIWALLKSGTAPEEIARRLGEEFDVTPARARKDVDALIRRLKDRGLLVEE
ncbi:MAG: PqqD family protein [Elusimicrobia bacterium]|nr:PqqD family protein [Elusimicrobiota bacterium]